MLNQRQRTTILELHAQGVKKREIARVLGISRLSAAVPHMRKQRSGCILQISSVGGRLTRPGKHALPCREMGRWRLHGISRSGTVAVRRDGLRP